MFSVIPVYTLDAFLYCRHGVADLQLLSDVFEKYNENECAKSEIFELAIRTGCQKTESQNAYGAAKDTSLLQMSAVRTEGTCAARQGKDLYYLP